MARRDKKAQVPTDELTASTRIDLTTGYDVRYLAAVTALSKRESKDPWRWFNEIGEVHYGVSRGARTAGYARLFPRKVLTNGRLGREVTGGMEAEIASMIRSPYGGQRAFCERFYTLRKVPGDAYLIRCREGVDGEGEVVGYDWLSADEISLPSSDSPSAARGGEWVFTPGQKITRITHPSVNGGAKLERQVRAEDFLGRVWRPAGQFADQADSPLRALATECELLRLLTIGLRAKMKSRLALNGILYVPSEVSEAKGGGPVADQGEVFSEDKVMDGLIRAATYGMLSHDDATAALPIFMRGPAQYAQALRFVMADLQIYETDMKLRAELIGRILTGLDQQPETVKGVGDSNHWSAWAVEDTERRVNIQPEIESMVWACTRLILHKEMQERGATEGRILGTALWYDLTQADVKTNKAEDSRQLHDRGVIGDTATRRMNGVDETDAPSEVEAIRQFGRKNKIPRLAFHEFEATKNWTDEDWEKVDPSKTGPAPDTDADESESGPGDDAGSPSKKTGDKLSIVAAVS